jgi:hypothetical protein
MTINRWFVRCRLCLSTATIEAVSLPKGEMKCGACQGPIEIMGRVNGCTSHLETRCKCDARCTNAKGPNCDCSCGGANHGKGMLATVNTNNVWAGCKPLIPFEVNITASAKALAHAAEFRTAMIPVNREIRELTEKRQKQGTLSSSDWTRKCLLENSRFAARKAKTHKSRMAILAKFAEVT